MKPYIALGLLTATLLGYCNVSRAEIGNTPPMTIRTFSVQYADIEELRETILLLVGSQGRVTVNRARRQLIVMGDPELMTPIEDLIKQVDILPKNVRIRVRFDDRGSSRHSEAGLKSKGAVVIKNGDVTGNVTVKPFLANQRGTVNNMTEQSLMVMSGRSGTLRVGERIPYADYFIQYGYHHGYIETQIRWEDVGASLVIEPTVIGDGPMVHVRVVPELSAMINGQPQRIRYASAATEVTVQDGQTLSIGGMNKDEEFYSRFLVGVSKGGAARQLDIQLTPEIISPAGR